MHFQRGCKIKAGSETVHLFSSYCVSCGAVESSGPETCKRFHIWAKGGAVSSCETHRPLCSGRTSTHSVALKSEVTAAFKAYRMRVQLPLRKSLLDFVKSWHVNAVACSSSCLYFFTAAEQVYGKTHIIAWTAGALSSWVCYWHALQTPRYSVILLSNKAEMSMTIKIFENPRRAASKDWWWLIIHLTLCVFWVQRVIYSYPRWSVKSLVCVYLSVKWMHLI